MQHEPILTPERAPARAPERAAATATGGEDFAGYVAAHQQSLLGFAHLLSGDFHGAEDLVQTVLAKAYLRWPKLSGSDHNVDAYVRRMLVNENASLWRRAWKRRERSSDQLPEVASVPADGDESTWRLVCALPAQQRAVVALRFYLDASVAETATVLGCTTGTVKSHTSRALAKLRAALEAEESSP